MTSLNLRSAVPEDADAIRALTRLAYAKWVPIIGREPRPMSADYDKAVREHIVHLHEENNRLTALIEMIPRGDHLLIENIAVHPECQKRGFGEAILHHAEQVARSQGLYELQLYTNALFETNVVFYTRRGFQEFRRESLADGGQLVHMRRSLRR